MKVNVIYGDDVEIIDCSASTKVEVLIQRAVEKLVTGWCSCRDLLNPINYQLFYPTKKPHHAWLLARHKTIGDYKIPEGARLVMAHVHVVGFR